MWIKVTVEPDLLRRNLRKLCLFFMPLTGFTTWILFTCTEIASIASPGRGFKMRILLEKVGGSLGSLHHRWGLLRASSGNYLGKAEKICWSQFSGFHKHWSWFLRLSFFVYTEKLVWRKYSHCILQPLRLRLSNPPLNLPWLDLSFN